MLYAATAWGLTWSPSTALPGELEMTCSMAKVTIDKAMIDPKNGKPFPKTVEWRFTGSALTQPDPNKEEKVYGADLTGNWVVSNPNADGTVRKTYFDLKQEGPRITGHIRVTQFYYSIKESSGGPDGFSITGSLMDGHNDRRVVYEGKLEGDELQIGTRR